MGVPEEYIYEPLERLAFTRFIPLAYIFALTSSTIFGFMVEKGIIRPTLEVPGIDHALSHTIVTLGGLLALSLGINSLGYGRVVSGYKVGSGYSRIALTTILVIVIGAGPAALSAVIAAVAMGGMPSGRALIRGIIILILVSMYLSIWLYLSQALTLLIRDKNKVAYLVYTLWFVLLPYGIGRMFAVGSLRPLLEGIAYLSPTYSLVGCVSPEGGGEVSLFSSATRLREWCIASRAYLSTLLVEYLVALAILLSMMYMFERARRL